MKTRSKISLACTAAGLLAVGAQAQVHNYHWSNEGGDGLWTTSDNWVSPEGQPGIPGGSNQHQVIIGSSEGGANASDPALFDASAGSVMIRNLHVGQGSGAVGVFNVTGGTLLHDTTADMRIGVGGGNGTLNQSGGTVSSGASLTKIGMGNSTGVYNLSGGSLIMGRESGGYSLRVGDENAGGNGTLNISGDGTILRSRAGVHIGRAGATGVFHVAGSGIAEIGIGAHDSLDGKWLQEAGGTLRLGIDAGGITPIEIADNGGTGADVFFAAGALLDPYLMEGAGFGSWRVMGWTGLLTDNGLAFAPGVDESIWSFSYESGDTELWVTAIPEPSTYALLFGGFALLMAAIIRHRRKS